MASVRIGNPAQGDTPDSFQLFVDAEFGQVPVFVENHETGAGLAEVYAHVQIAACELRLELKNCKRQQGSGLYGDAPEDDERRKIRERREDRTSSETQAEAEVNAGASASPIAIEAHGSCKARASAARQSSREIVRQTDRVLPVQAVDPCGFGKWLVYDRERETLSGPYLRSHESVFCALSATGPEFEASVSLVCDPDDLTASFHENGGVFNRFRSISRTHQKLVELALKKGLLIHKREPNLFELARSRLKGTK